jgi:hypothetical protein
MLDIHRITPNRDHLSRARNGEYRCRNIRCHLILGGFGGHTVYGAAASMLVLTSSVFSIAWALWVVSDAPMPLVARTGRLVAVGAAVPLVMLGVLSALA